MAELPPYDYYGADLASMMLQNQMQPPQPAQPDLAREILAARFEPTAMDIGNAALAGVAGDSYVSPDTFADKRMATAMQQLAVAAKLQRSMTGQDRPSAVQTYEYYENLPPEKKPGFMSVIRNPWLNIGGAMINPYDNTQIAKTLPPEQNPQLKGDQERQQKAAALEVDRRAAMPKAQAAFSSFEMNAGVVRKNIEEARKLIKEGAAGYGALAGVLPETKARKLAGIVNTIKANVSFDKLQQMREASPTGGALGQVSDFENRLLQATQGTLDPYQSDLLLESLNQIDSLIPLVLDERRKAFELDYGAAPQGVTPSGGPTPEEAAAELERRRRERERQHLNSGGV